jgi:hypothetical protein
MYSRSSCSTRAWVAAASASIVASRSRARLGDQLGGAHAGTGLLLLVGRLDQLRGAAELAARADRRARQRAEIADRLVGPDPARPRFVVRIVAAAQRFGNAVALVLVHPPADHDLVLARGRARIVAVDVEHGDLVAGFVLRGGGSGRERHRGAGGPEQGGAG